VVTQNPHAGSGTPFFGGNVMPADFFWPLVMALSVVAFGLSMEIILRLLKVKNSPNTNEDVRF